MTSKTLRLVLKSCWYDKIKSGVKTHEYREVKPYWIKRIYGIDIPVNDIINHKPNVDIVELVKGYKSPVEKMDFTIKNITLTRGIKTDLKLKDPVFDIELGQRL